MAHKAFVFLSCGQRNGERQLAKQIQAMIESEFHLNCYNADSRQGFDDVMSITEHLARADYYLFIDFKRDGDIPISVFTHQEFALARAWGITEMLAFREKGLGPHGMIGYVLAHPVEFDRASLLDVVRAEIKKKQWKPDYSRNLVVTNIHSSGPVTYGDHQGQRIEKIWLVHVENRREDRAALNATAVLESVSDTTSGKVSHPDSSFLKWAGQQGYQRTILPGGSADVDLFAVRANENGIFLHSASDWMPRSSIVLGPGLYELNYLIYAETFPLLRLKVIVNHKGGIATHTGIKDTETTASLSSAYTG